VGDSTVVLGTLTLEEGSTVTANSNIMVGTLKSTGNSNITKGESVTITVTGSIEEEFPIENITIGEDATVKALTLAVDTLEELGDAITEMKALTNAESRVIQLTADFYSATESAASAIIVDPGTTDNETPYTIRGLGKNSSETIKVGILLANDNVTLEDVHIVAARDKGAPLTATYNAAITISRATAGAFTNQLTGNDRANKNVTVRNSTIVFTATSGMTAGIGVAHTNPTESTTYANPEYITINGNDITVTNTSGSATQGLFIKGYETTLVITNNTVESSNENPNDGSSDAPASGLFMQGPARTDTQTPQISGNTFEGSSFDFYVNAFSLDTTYVGHERLVANNFGTAETVWITANSTDSTSFYRNLITALISQSKPDGYGELFMYLGSGTGDSFATESYELTGGKVTAIDYWSSGITNGAYAHDNSDKLGIDPKKSNEKGIRARRIVAANGDFSDGNYHWIRGGADNVDNNLSVAQGE
jgi:hypothetical protein